MLSLGLPRLLKKLFGREVAVPEALKLKSPHSRWFVATSMATAGRKWEVEEICGYRRLE